MQKKNTHIASNGFINQLLDNINDFYAKSFQQFKFYKKLMGTKVIITRMKDGSDYKDVFGSIYSSTLLDDSDKEEFEYTVLLNLNDMRQFFQKTIEQLDFFDNEQVVMLGDVLTYSRRKQEYKFKVVRMETFSEADDVLYRYTIVGMTEVNSLK